MIVYIHSFIFTFKVPSKYIAIPTDSNEGRQYEFKRHETDSNEEGKIVKGDRYLGGKDACKVNQCKFNILSTKPSTL